MKRIFRKYPSQFSIPIRPAVSKTNPYFHN